MRINRAARQSAEDARRERGAAAFVLTAFFGFLILFGVGALALDLSRTADRGQDLQNASDAAALAAVVAYENAQVGGVADPEDVARAAAVEILLQNGFDIGSSNLDMEIGFPGLAGRVWIKVSDHTQRSVLGPIVEGTLGADQTIEREATAEFLSCEFCQREVPIPGPFSAASVVGKGDGFIPIEVGDKLYALNHNNGNNEIVCVDIQTGRPCWRQGDDPTAPREPGRPAYASGVYSGRSPEMPHAGVVNGRIYWSATAPSGLHLYCFDTVSDTPCGGGIRLGDDPRGVTPTQPFFNEGGGTLFKDEARGGGTIAYSGRLYVFSDNHEIHCFDPAAGTWCTGFNGVFGSLPTGLAVFPDSDVAVGNHGGSIDRIVDETTGFIYSTIHIPVADQTDADCSVTTPATTVDDMVGRVITIESAGQYLSSPASGSVVVSNDPTNPVAQWRVAREGADPSVYLQAVAIDEWLDDPSAPSLPALLDTDVDQVEDDNEWNIVAGGGGFTVEHEESQALHGSQAFLNLTTLNTAVIDVGPATVWNIAICADPAADAGYTSGTWLHCFDTGVVSGVVGACPIFVQDVPLHVDPSRFSGRLFFHYDQTPADVPAAKEALCSTGFVTPYSRGTVQAVEVNCVNLVTGVAAPLDYTAFESTLNGSAGGVLVTGPSPGAWGVPHYNAFQNRMFYPSQHNSNRVLCWDFNTNPASMCGTAAGRSQAIPGVPADLVNGVPADPPIPASDTEDYGYISKDNCVFGLGHEAAFWAFRADDVGEPCVGSTTHVDISMCLCTGGEPRWGVLDFSEINFADFDVLQFQITTIPAPNDADGFGDLIWPPALPGQTRREVWHNWVPDGGATELNLDDILNPGDLSPPPFTDVRLVFYAEADIDAFDQAVGKIGFLQKPYLVE